MRAIHIDKPNTRNLQTRKYEERPMKFSKGNAKRTAFSTSNLTRNRKTEFRTSNSWMTYARTPHARAGISVHMHIGTKARGKAKMTLAQFHLSLVEVPHVSLTLFTSGQP